MTLYLVLFNPGNLPFNLSTLNSPWRLNQKRLGCRIFHEELSAFDQVRSELIALGPICNPWIDEVLPSMYRDPGSSCLADEVLWQDIPGYLLPAAVLVQYLRYSDAVEHRRIKKELRQLMYAQKLRERGMFQ